MIIGTLHQYDASDLYSMLFLYKFYTNMQVISLKSPDMFIIIL